jgi:hypothetical protein
MSLIAIHRRVFFVQLGLDTLQSWLATAESVIVIECVFIAKLIQRLFRSPTAASCGWRMALRYRGATRSLRITTAL